MTVVYDATGKNKRMQVSADLVDGKTPAAATGSASAGSLVIGTSALNGGATGVLVTIPLSVPGLSVSAAVMTMQGLPASAVASASGTAAKAEFRDSAGNVRIACTVGTSGSGADIIIGSTAITTGLTVKVTAATITHG